MMTPPPTAQPPYDVHDTPTQLSSAFTLKPTRPGCTAVDRGGWCCSCAAGWLEVMPEGVRSNVTRAGLDSTQK